MYPQWNHRLNSGVSKVNARRKTKAAACLLAIFHHVHQDSRHQAILSKCTASEFLQSLQSSDELKMYAWVEIFLVCIIIITLKGNSYNFKMRRLILGIIYQEDFTTFARVQVCIHSHNFCHLSLFSISSAEGAKIQSVLSDNRKPKRPLIVH